MSDRRERLIECFTAVFPALTPESAPSASLDNLAAWDSAHHFMLMQVIEESFGIRIPEAVLGEVESFEDFDSYLAQQQIA